jgi:hypothetical protein
MQQMGFSRPLAPCQQQFACEQIPVADQRQGGGIARGGNEIGAAVRLGQ